MLRSSPEVADILGVTAESFLSAPSFSFEHRRAIIDITKCRTAALGGHQDLCSGCGETTISYNSCRNRNCPKCGAYKREKWVASRERDLIDVGYFHVVFTIPECLKAIFYQNQSTCYTLLFRCAWESLKTLAADKKFLGATPGAISVLHTWTQKLIYHPHVHMLVPAGGLTSDVRWIASHTDFLVPVKALSKMFRAKLIASMRAAEMSLFRTQGQKLDCSALYREAFNAKWVVYCKPPYADAAGVLRYLGRYTHRTAISNSRISAFDGGSVTFKWRDRSDNNVVKNETISAREFTRRFLMHIPPIGFMRIRHYGFLANRGKKERITQIKRLTRTPISNTITIDSATIVEKLIGRRPGVCQHCGCKLIAIPLIE